jgi:hypothetical protein
MPRLWPSCRARAQDRTVLHQRRDVVTAGNIGERRVMTLAWNRMRGRVRKAILVERLETFMRRPYLAAIEIHGEIGLLS